MVAQRVVDGLQVVDVDEVDRAHGARRRGLVGGRGDAIGQAGAVRQPGERVVGRLLLEPVDRRAQRRRELAVVRQRQRLAQQHRGHDHREDRRRGGVELAPGRRIDEHRHRRSGRDQDRREVHQRPQAASHQPHRERSRVAEHHHPGHADHGQADHGGDVAEHHHPGAQVQGVLEQVQQPAEGQGGEPQRHQCRSALGGGVLLTGQHDRDADAGDRERDRHGEHRSHGVERRVAALPQGAAGDQPEQHGDREARDRGVHQRAETASPWSQVGVPQRCEQHDRAREQEQPVVQAGLVGAGAHDLGEAHCGAHAEDPETERQQGDELGGPHAASHHDRPRRGRRTRSDADRERAEQLQAEQVVADHGQCDRADHHRRRGERDDRDRHRGTGPVSQGASGQTAAGGPHRASSSRDAGASTIANVAVSRSSREMRSPNIRPRPLVKPSPSR